MKLSRTVLGLAAALLAGAAWAHEDGPMATAGASGAPPVAAQDTAQAGLPAPAPAGETPARPLTTAEQIDAFIQGSPAARPSPDEMAALDALRDEGLEPERRVHGSVEVGVGTHGYRHGRVEAHYPVGKTGHVSVAVGSTRGRGLIGACPGRGPYGVTGHGVAAGPFGQGCHGAW